MPYMRRLKFLKKTKTHVDVVVHGTKDYNVEINFEKDKIKDMSCECPYYASTTNCKHLAATLYIIYGFEKPLKHEPISTEELLNLTNNEELKEFLKKEFEENTDLYNKLRVFKGHTDETYYMDKLKRELYDFEPCSLSNFIDNDIAFLVENDEYELVLLLLDKIFDELYNRAEYGHYDISDDTVFYSFESIIEDLSKVYFKSKILDFLNNLINYGNSFLIDDVSKLIADIEYEEKNKKQ